MSAGRARAPGASARVMAVDFPLSWLFCIVPPRPSATTLVETIGPWGTCGRCGDPDVGENRPFQSAGLHRPPERRGEPRQPAYRGCGQSEPEGGRDEGQGALEAAAVVTV